MLITKSVLGSVKLTTNVKIYNIYLYNGDNNESQFKNELI